MKYKDLKKIIDELKKCAANLHSDHPAMIAAEKTGNDIVLGIVSEALTVASTALNDAVDVLNGVTSEWDDEEFTEETLGEIAALASKFDSSGNSLLMKQASVLDQILLTIAAPKGAKEEFLKTQDAEIEKLRAKFREESLHSCYSKAKEESDKDIKVAEMAKAIDKGVKEYRPMEAPLSTRTCPDHPGAQVMRIADSVYQCDLDKQIYNYQSGFTTMRGNQVPGGDVSGQTQSANDREVARTIFDTRESRLNP